MLFSPVFLTIFDIGMKIFTYFTLLFIIFLAACKKEKIESVGKPNYKLYNYYPWTELKGASIFKGQRIILPVYENAFVNTKIIELDMLGNEDNNEAKVIINSNWYEFVITRDDKFFRIEEILDSNNVHQIAIISMDLNGNENGKKIIPGLIEAKSKTCNGGKMR
jgi:hypothetical protein